MTSLQPKLHPLDPTSPDEMRASVAIVRRRIKELHPNVNGIKTRFVEVSLYEPDKQDVLLFEQQLKALRQSMRPEAHTTFNSNGSADANRNGNGNANANGHANGNRNGNGNGRGNGLANGNGHGDGNGNGHANGNGNGSGNGSGNGNGTSPLPTLISLPRRTYVNYILILPDFSYGCYEAIVNLQTGTVESESKIEHGQPAMCSEEYHEVEHLVKNDKRFQDIMFRRGISDMDLLMIDAWCGGYFSPKDHPSRRMNYPLIWCRETPDDDNGYAKPIMNVFVAVDLVRMEVLEVRDYGYSQVPVSDPFRHYTPKFLKKRNKQQAQQLGVQNCQRCVENNTGQAIDQAIDQKLDEGYDGPLPLRPLEVIQDKGCSYVVRGNEVIWEKWRFRVGFTAKEGIVLYNVSFFDTHHQRRRPIAYRMSFAEMVVPYGDPRPPHYRKNAFDAGEDGLGRNAHSLKLGCDCLGVIHYFDGYTIQMDGEPQIIKNAICLHEEDDGILWKHQDWRNGRTEVRRARKLIISFICTVANYEYGFFWYFYQNGGIQSEVKLTGILSTGSEDPGRVPPWGTMLNDQLYAPVHQHWWSVRLDMMVDGANNSVVEVETVSDPPGPENPYLNAFRPVRTLLTDEISARRQINPANNRYWVICNPNVLNRTGKPVAYKLVPLGNTFPLAHINSSIRKRAAFMNNHLWVTRYDRTHRYPSGDHPNQAIECYGLTKWGKADNPIVNTDVVVWYTFGVTHTPNLEDWPVMPVERISFMLQPCGFFDFSPCIDAPSGCSDRSVHAFSKL